MSQYGWGGQVPTPAQPARFGPYVGFQAQPPPPPAPPPRRSPLKFLLVGLIVLTVLALGGLAVVGFVGVGTSSSPYVNDDHEIPPPSATPPDLPMPASQDQAKEWLEANKIYDQTMPAPVRCEVPRIDFATATDADLKTHFEALMACLVRAWEVPAQQAGFTIVRPTVTIYADKIATKCGESGINAFYCAADQQVYFSSKIPSRVPIMEENPWTADIIIAHEFGHAVQARTGILAGYYVTRQQIADDSEKLLLSRRVETQADCFSGLWARSVSRSIGLTQADVPVLVDSYFQFGDDVLSGKPDIVSDHGHGATRRYWGQIGLSTNNIGKCNTFVASPDLLR